MKPNPKHKKKVPTKSQATKRRETERDATRNETNSERAEESSGRHERQEKPDGHKRNRTGTHCPIAFRSRRTWSPFCAMALQNGDEMAISELKSQAVFPRSDRDASNRIALHPSRHRSCPAMASYLRHEIVRASCRNWRGTHRYWTSEWLQISSDFFPSLVCRSEREDRRSAR